MGKQLKIILSVSVLLNFLLVGIMLGHFIKHERRKGPGPGPQALLSQLSPEQALAYRKAMKTLKDEHRAKRKKIKQARQEALSLLTQASFDEKSFLAKLSEVQALYGAKKAKLGLVVAHLASQMNLQERQILAELLKQGPLGTGRRGKSWRHRGGPPPQHRQDRPPIDRGPPPSPPPTRGP